MSTVRGIRRLLVVLTLGYCFQPAISYATIQYDYVGDPYTQAVSPYTTSMHITISFVVDNYISAPQLDVKLLPGFQLLQWSDGLNSYQLGDLIQTHFNGVSGNLPTAWEFAASNPVATAETNQFNDLAHLETGESASVFTPGTWRAIETAVPEPAAGATLMLLACCGVGTTRWKRLRQSNRG
jgi:hypothetical protein